MPTAATTAETESNQSAVPRSYAPRVIGASAVALALTAPGQTAAISAFVDPLIAGLGLPRSAVAAAYLLGTPGRRHQPTHDCPTSSGHTWDAPPRHTASA